MTVETTSDGPVWIITNNRPQARNAVDPETADALHAAFQAFNAAEEASPGRAAPSAAAGT